MSTANQTAPAIKLAELVAGKTGGSAYVMSAEERHEIEHALHHYDDNRAASIDALKIVQKRHGWVPDGAIAAIGAVLGISAADVEGVATFYNLIFRQPVGRHVITVCDSISCFLTGYDGVREAISRKLGIGLGETTADGRFTLLPICCLGACDKGPVLMIDEDTHVNVAADTIDQLLEQYS